MTGSTVAALQNAEAGGAEAFTLEQWTNFFAHCHPLVLHLPIGLLCASALLEFISLFSSGSRPARRWINAAFAGTAVLAGLSGWLLGGGEDYGGALLDEHRQFGIAASVAAVVVGLADVFGRSGGASFFRRVALLAAMALITMAGHRGGMMTHGKSFLSEHAPPWLAPHVGVIRERRSVTRPEPKSAAEPEAPMVGAEASSGPEVGPEMDPATGGADPAPVTVTAHGLSTSTDAAAGNPPALAQVVAVFRDRCFECHDEFKSKGSLRFDELSGWEDTIDTDEPEDSELLYRMLLPADDGDAMPPKGDRLDPAIIDAVRVWIESGAPTDELEGLLQSVDQEFEQAAASLDDVRAQTAASITESVPAPAGEREPPLSVSWSHTPEAPTAVRAAALAPIADRIVELAWAGTEAGDGVIEALPPLPMLSRVHFERTPVTDRGVEALLERAPNLEYLNLHSTSVSEGVTELTEAAPSLTEVVLFGTAARSAPEDPFALVGKAQPRRLLIGDGANRKVALLRERAIGKADLLWERPVEAVHDLQWLGETEGGHGRVLTQESWTRVVEIDTRSNEVVWSYDAAPEADEPVEIHSFRRLDDGTTMIAESGRARLAFVDASGTVTHEIALTVTNPDPHRDTRLVRETSAGTFLVAHEGDGVIREYDREGAVIWSFEVPLGDRERAPGHGFEGHGNQAFGALRLADGDTLIATGNGSSFLRVSPQGEITWRLEQDGVADVRLAWTTCIQELSNGNFVLGNCHAGADQPQAIEVSPKGQWRWAFQDHERFGDGVSNVVVIERTDAR